MSFKDEVELSMIPGKVRSHKHHVISDGKSRGIKALKAAVLYGANASGKSNLIKAMDFARNLIVTGRRPRELILVRPFKFDTDSENKPSQFEFEFKCNATFFNYGFVADAEKIHEEWLYEITPSSEKSIFERETTAEGETTVEFGTIKYANPDDREFLRFTGRGTRPNQLFLTESIERGLHYFEAAYNWFNEILVIVFPQSRPVGLESELTNKVFNQTFQTILDLFDTGISGIELLELGSDEDMPRSIRTFRDQFQKGTDQDAIIQGPDGRYLLSRYKENEIRVSKFMTLHRVKGETQPVLFEVNDESDGTQRLFDLIPALMELRNTERVFVIDELDRSLHPHLSYKILELFLNSTTRLQSQLIVTTHESRLLDFDLLRRDEIWFLEKDSEGRSSLYSLEEFNIRDDMDIRKGYLLGRFGGIPIIKNLTEAG
ncbi:MAG: ATP-binding protein [Anaerolineae bacterium]|nr:ATP-binding protein [Anaerolineae bacterium]